MTEGGRWDIGKWDIAYWDYKHATLGEHPTIPTPKFPVNILLLFKNWLDKKTVQSH